jgi:hypothetical protein
MGKRKVPVVHTYHVRYVSDVLVQASSTKEAYAKSDAFMYDQLDSDLELEDVFEITLESNHFHIVPDEYFDEGDEEEESEDEEEEDEGEDEELDDEEDEDDDEDDDEDEDTED